MLFSIDSISSGPEKKDDDKKSSSEVDRKSSRKSKEEREKMFTADPHLLLSFVYFDQSHAGYLLDKDMEDIFHIIGLQLSRSQVDSLI